MKHEMSQRMFMDNVIHILNNVPMACALLDANFKIVQCNLTLAVLFGLRDPREYIHIERFSPPFQPDGSESIVRMNEIMGELIKKGRPVCFDWLYCNPDTRELIPAFVTMLRIHVPDKNYLLAFMQDMRESHQARLAERVAKQRLQAMMDSCPLACGIVDQNFKVQECNHEVVNLFGLLDKQSFINRFFDLSPEYQPDGRLSRQKAMDKLKFALETGRTRYEWLHINRAGEQIPCEVTMVCVSLDDQPMAIIYIHDLREIKETIEMVEKMESIAYVDELTSLFTRRYFMDNADAALEECKQADSPYHILMADLDYFKSVNDTYGHVIGDEVLKITASRISNTVRKGTIVSRYGGEEFILLLTKMSYDDAVKTAWRIQKTIEGSRFMIRGIGIDVTVSVGVSTLTDSGQTLNELIDMADNALYAAKRAGRNRVMEHQNVPLP